MKTLYLECNMGAAGDMLMAALAEIHPNAENFVKEFNGLGLPKVKLHMEKGIKCGIVGTHMRVTIDRAEEKSNDVSVHNHHIKENYHIHGNQDRDSEGKEPDYHYGHQHGGHTPTGFHEIEHIIHGLNIPEKVKEDAANVYRLIAEAESNAHGKPISDIHFHEVGTMDAVADVVGVCMLINDIAPDKIITSPIHVGSGQVKCAHGILPVPAPATAYILRGVPIYGGNIQGELCTPTGAALIKHFTDEFAGMPMMQIDKIGYGMGNKDFPVANCVRAVLGERTDDTSLHQKENENKSEYIDNICELCCNLDDMTPEHIGFVTELLMKEGALDVYTTSVFMKKNRPGVILSCMCKEEDKQKFVAMIMKYTTTLGVREYTCRRYVLDRNVRVKQTKFGEVHIKTSSGYGVNKEKIEYEDLAEIAAERSASIGSLEKEIEKELQ